jgi:hypothetical protein
MMKFFFNFVVVCFFYSISFAYAKEINASLDLVQGNIAKSQQLIRVKQNDQINLKVSSDEPGEFHLHAYQLAVKLSPNQAQTMSFKAYATGRFQFEWHPAANAKAPPSHHHALATIEVFPN